MHWISNDVRQCVTGEAENFNFGPKTMANGSSNQNVYLVQLLFSDWF